MGAKTLLNEDFNPCLGVCGDWRDYPDGATMSEERLAVIEVKQKFHEETLSDVVEQLKTLNNNVDEIKGKLDRNTGFLAGAAFVFSMFGAFIGMGGAKLLKIMGGE